jgi:hypothetical protein
LNAERRTRNRRRNAEPACVTASLRHFVTHPRQIPPTGISAHPHPAFPPACHGVLLATPKPPAKAGPGVVPDGAGRCSARARPRALDLTTSAGHKAPRYSFSLLPFLHFRLSPHVRKGALWAALSAISLAAVKPRRACPARGLRPPWHGYGSRSSHGRLALPGCRGRPDASAQGGVRSVPIVPREVKVKFPPEVPAALREER